MSRIVQRYLARALALGLVLYGAAATIAWLQAFRNAKVARGLMEEAAALIPGSASLQDAVRLHNHYERFAEPFDCANQPCALHFRIDNRWLHTLQLSRLTVFKVDIFVRDVRVT